VPQIEVTFDIDANGILNVTARDRATGKEQRVTITASTNLSKEEIERMVQEAKAHEAEDQRRRQLIEARNAADAMAYQTEKALRELGDKLPAGERERIQNKVNELKEALKGEDTEHIKRLTEEVQQMWHTLSQQLYQQQQAAGGAPGANGGTAAPGGENKPNDGEGEVVDGEFREA